MRNRSGGARIIGVALLIVGMIGLSACNTQPDDTPYALQIGEGAAVFNAYYDLRFEMTANPPLAVESGSIAEALEAMEQAESSMDLPSVQAAASSIRDAVEGADEVGLERVHGAPLSLLHEYVDHMDAFLATQESQGQPFIECVRGAVSGLPDSTPVLEIQNLPESEGIAECLLAILPEAETGTAEMQAMLPIMEELEEAWHSEGSR